MLPGGTNMIDFDHSISNSSSHESNNLNSDFIGSKRSEDSEEIFKDDEFEDSEAKKVMMKMEIGTLKMAPKLISNWISQMILSVFWIVMFFRSTSRRWGVIPS